MIQEQRNAQGDQDKRRTGRRGFAAMDPERQRKIAREGGVAAHQKGRAHEFSSDEAREAGRKGGQAVSRDREHMSRIGSKGGRASRGRRGTTRPGTEEPAQGQAGDGEVASEQD